MEFLQQDPTPIESYKHHKEGSIKSLYYQSGGKGEQIVSGGGESEGIVSVYDKKKKSGFRLIGHEGGVNCVRVSKGGGQVISCGMDKTVRVWENSVRGESRVLKHHTGAVRCIDISSDDSMLLSCSDDKTIKVIPLQSSTVHNVTTLKGGTNWVRSCAFSKDSRLVLSGGDDKMVNVFDIESQKKVIELGQQSVVQQVEWSHDSSCLAVGLGNGQLKVTDLRSRQLLQQYEVTGLTQFDYHPNSHYMIAGSGSMVKIYDLRMAKLIYSLQGHSQQVTAVAFNSTGTRFISAGQDKIIDWNMNTDNHNNIDQREREREREQVEEHHQPQIGNAVQLEGTLDKIINQLDIVNSTLNVFEQRIGNSEEQISSINVMINEKLRGVEELQNQLADLSVLQNNKSSVQFSKAPNYQ